MIESLVVYLGLLVVVAGLVSLIRPIRSMGIPSRGTGGYYVAVGALLAIFGALLPAPVVAATRRASMIDDFLPRYQFHEVHSTDVHATPEAVYDAVKKVTAREIHLFRLLTWIRSPHFGSSSPSLLAAPPDEPLLNVATRSGFMILGEAPPNDLVFGTVGGRPLRVVDPTPQDFRNLNRPGYAKIAMNFTIAAAPNGWSKLTTETRIYATDERARQRFGAYWRVIYPGSSLIRIMWLNAVKKRAEE